MYPEIVMMLASAAIASLATRVVTNDLIARPVRNLAAWIDIKRGITADTPPEHEGGPVRLDTFMTCPRCVGWWLALASFAGGYVTWPGHAWDAPQLFVWAAAACTTNLVYAAIAATSSRIADFADSAELRMHDHRRMSL